MKLISHPFKDNIDTIALNNDDKHNALAVNL